MDELKEAFDYQADSHIFLGSPQPMLRDMRFDDVSMPPEPDDAPVEKRGDRRQRREDIKAVPPKYNEDQLAVMPEWIGASKKMFSVMNDGERFIGSDKQAAAYGLDLMSEFNWNMTGPAGIPGESGISVPGFAFQVAALMSDTAGEENAMTFLQMLHTYSDTSTNGATIKRAFRGIFADPLTYAGGFGKLYAMAAKSLAGKVSGAVLKDMLMKTAAGTAMPYDLAVKYPGRTGMVAGAGYGAGFEGGTMAVEDAAGLEPTVGEAATRLGTAGTVGAAVGGVGSKVLSKAIPAAGSAVRQGLDTAGQAAEARMAERGPITDRVMSGVDPMEVIDPALAAAGKLVRPTKENPVTAVPPTETEPGIIAFHGSGADFDEFKLEKIGTGEGAQAYGHGLYFTDSEAIAKFYRNSVSAIDRYAEPDFDTMAGGWTEELGFDLIGGQRTLSSADPDYDYYIQQLDDYAVDKVTDLTNNSKTWQFSDGSELTMETDDVATFNGKPLDSVYTRDVEDRFGVDIKRIANEARKFGIRDDVDTLEDDINTILANLSQGLHDMQDMQAAVDSLGRSTRYQTIYKKFIEPNIDFNKVDYVTLAGHPKGKMYKVGLTPKPDDLLDYDAPFSEQTKSVQENLVKAGYDVDPNTSGSGGMILDAIMSNIAKEGAHLELGGKKSHASQIASKRLSDAGIPGIKYRAAGSRSSDVSDAAAKRNYVIFDDKAIKILEKYGIVGPVAITALGAAKQEGDEDASST